MKNYVVLREVQWNSIFWMLILQPDLFVIKVIRQAIRVDNIEFGAIKLATLRNILHPMQ